ncbi:splicing regulator SDE2 isoform X1 [Manis pentadactyla]|uniref:splicing regulator SDE2 isoform X1 n=1 Tax=Manis pentadactyla TaxID=143292 RepID=UPI00255D022D|nr:splicing regulator SDE2 isoform X1 [Manis pentadactyla]
MAESALFVWLCGPGFGCKAVRWGSAPCSVLDFIRRHRQDQDVPVECFFVKCNGSLINTNDMVQHGAVYSLEPRLCGGKGGFGSMLRALGAQIEKTTNREACRDLSGRRLRDVNHEKAMAEWVRQQAEREAEKEQKRLERLQRQLAGPGHCLTSPGYQQQCHEMAERLEDSVLKVMNTGCLATHKSTHTHTVWAYGPLNSVGQWATGMQAASSKMVSAEISENRKRPNKSKTDKGARAEKRKCFWLGLEGLETAEGSSTESSDDDSDEAPSTSGMRFHGPKTGSDSVEMAFKLPNSSQKSTDSRSQEELRTPEADPGSSISEDLCAELGETPARDIVERKMALEIQNTQEEEEEAERKEPIEKEVAGTGLNKEQETKEMTDGERAAKVAPGEGGENTPVAKLEESQSGNTDVGKETIDLQAFHSAAEMELLGLEKLKWELMALGLKCGGTLHERAARLFSVRGLAQGQIDPALFAKPLKGKKK